MSAEDLQMIKDLKELIDIVKNMVDTQNLLIKVLDERISRLEKQCEGCNV